MRFSFTFTAEHVPGVLNEVADALSQFQMQEFQQLAPEARMSPVPVTIQLLEELTRPLWKCNATISSAMVELQLLVVPMPLVRGGLSSFIGRVYVPGSG